MANSDRTTIAWQSNDPPAGRTEAEVAMDVQFEPHEHLRNAKRYLHGEPQTELYKKYKNSSPEIRAHWQACRILERAGEKVLNDIEKRWAKRRAASERGKRVEIPC